MYQHWLTKSQLNKRVHSQIVVVHVGLPIIIIYNVACKKINFVLRCLLKLLVCHEESSVTGFIPLLVITHLLQLLLQKQFPQLLQRLLQKQLLLKPNLLKYLTIKCHKNVKNSQQDSLNHLQQLNLIIVVQNIEIESLWNLEQLCKICIESIVNRSQQLKYIV